MPTTPESTPLSASSDPIPIPEASASFVAYASYSVVVEEAASGHATLAVEIDACEKSALEESAQGTAEFTCGSAGVEVRHLRYCVCFQSLCIPWKLVEGKLRLFRHTVEEGAPKEEPVRGVSIYSIPDCGNTAVIESGLHSELPYIHAAGRHFELRAGDSGWLSMMPMVRRLCHNTVLTTILH